jgi:hypothetical protein
MTSYSFHYLPEQDRLAMTFTQSEGTPPVPVQLTRRLVKLLGSYLRRYIEKNTSLPDSVTIEDKDDIFQFMHMSELEGNPPTWDSGTQKKMDVQDLSNAALITRVDIQYGDKAVRLVFSQQQKQLVSLSLAWQSLHSFFYSLAEMSRKADWSLDGVFEWSGRALQVQEGRRQ